MAGCSTTIILPLTLYAHKLKDSLNPVAELVLLKKMCALININLYNTSHSIHMSIRRHHIV